MSPHDHPQNGTTSADPYRHRALWTQGSNASSDVNDEDAVLNVTKRRRELLVFCGCALRT